MYDKRAGSNIVGYLSRRRTSITIDGNQINYPLIENYLLCVINQAEKLFSINELDVVIRSVRLCCNPVGYLLPGMLDLITRLLRLIPSQSQLDLAQKTLSRGVFFRPALLTCSEALNIRPKLDELRNSCMQYISTSLRVQKSRDQAMTPQDEYHYFEESQLKCEP